MGSSLQIFHQDLDHIPPSIDVLFAPLLAILHKVSISYSLSRLARDSDLISPSSSSKVRPLLHHDLRCINLITQVMFPIPVSFILNIYDGWQALFTIHRLSMWTTYCHSDKPIVQVDNTGCLIALFVSSYE